MENKPGYRVHISVFQEDVVDGNTQLEMLDLGRKIYIPPKYILHNSVDANGETIPLKNIIENIIVHLLTPEVKTDLKELLDGK